MKLAELQPRVVRLLKADEPVRQNQEDRKRIYGAEAQRRYRERHPDRVLAARKEWEKKNPHYMRDWVRRKTHGTERDAAVAQRRYEARKRHYENNREEIASRKRERYHNDPVYREKILKAARDKRARENAGICKVTKSSGCFVARRGGTSCVQA